MATESFTLRYSKSASHSLDTTTAKASPNGQYIATASADATIHIFALSDFRFIRSLSGHTLGINDVAWSPDSRYLASVSDDTTLRVWDVDFGECIRLMEGHTYHVTCVEFNYKGNLLITGSSDEAVMIWDPLQQRCLKTLSAHSDPIVSVDVIWDGTVIATASYDGTIRLFDTESGQCLKTLVYDRGDVSFPVSYIRFSPNGKYLLASTLDNTLRLWDYMKNKVMKTYKGANLEKYSCSSRFITFTKTPMVVSGSETGSVVFWDLQTKKIVHTLEVTPGSPVIEVDVHENVIIAVSLDGTLNVYDVTAQLENGN